MNSTFTQSILNLLYDTSTAAYFDIYGNSYCNGTLAANDALTLNSPFISSILNFVYHRATAAYMYIYIYGNTYCNITLAVNNALTLNNTVTYYDSATAGFKYIYGNTYCNETLTANNALTLNSMYTQSILKFDIQQYYCTMPGTWQRTMLELRTARLLNWFLIWYTTV